MSQSTQVQLALQTSHRHHQALAFKVVFAIIICPLAVSEKTARGYIVMLHSVVGFGMCQLYHMFRVREGLNARRK